MSTSAASSPSRRPLCARMAMVAGLAFVVGLAFNSISPLGVRLGHGPSAEPVGASAESAPGSAHPAGPKGVYENQTLGLSLETAGAATTAAAGAPSTVPGVPTLTWPETSKLLAAHQIILVDARAAVYYQTDHVPGAVSLPATSSASELATFTAQYPKNTPVVVYCTSPQCPLAGELVGVLSGRLGYTNVREMPGGFAEYRRYQSQLAKGGAR